MAATLEQTFDAIAPQFKGASDKEVFFELSALRTSARVYGSRYNLAVALRAAHMKELSLRNGASGAVASRSEGDLSESFASVGDAHSDLSQTSFGTQLLSLRASCGPRVLVTGLVGGFL